MFTHLDKVFWPQEGYTKGDLINYYRQISSVLLPYLKDRPQNLNRFPDGIKGQNFYQKDFEYDLPEFARTVQLHSESNDREINYLVCDNVDTLLFMVNLGCIEINPWSSRTANIDYPDYMIFDLDPTDIGFHAVVQVAQQVRSTLEELNINSYCKTSGKDGLHIYVPLGAKYDYDQVRQLAESLAQLARDQLPELISLEHKIAERSGKVLIDYTQNRHGQTTSSAYSVRPRPFAPVSTPLKWEEVNAKLDPKQFTMHNIFKRIDKLGDMWKPVQGKGIDIDKVLKVLEKKHVYLS